MYICMCIYRNVRSEVDIKDLAAIFSSFGPICSSKIVGDSYLVTSTAGVSVRASTAHIEYESNKTALEAVSLHNSDVGGVLLTVELLITPPTPTTTTSAGSGGDTDHRTTVKLTNLVNDNDEVFEDDFQEEIEEEARQYGALLGVRVCIGQVNVTGKDKAAYEEVVRGSGGAPVGGEVSVYLKYKEHIHAKKAIAALHGRHFGGLTIVAVLVSDEEEEK